MSSELIWNVIRSNNAYKLTRGKVTFSTEAGNLRNKHSSKYSGLANRKVVDVNVNESGAVVLSAKRTKKAANPATSFGRVQLSKNNYRSSAKAIRTLTSGYAPELRAAALARFHRLNKTAKAAALLKARAAKKAAKAAPAN